MPQWGGISVHVGKTVSTVGARQQLCTLASLDMARLNELHAAIHALYAGVRGMR